MHLWHLDLSRLAGALRTALDGTAGQQPAPPLKRGQLRFAQRFFLRLLLGSYLGVPGKAVKITRNRKGKPVLDPLTHGGGLHFSMAKSNDRLLLGLSTSDYLGVDLEPLCRRAHRPLGVASRYFSAAEFEQLNALEGELLQASFLRAWACKEAVVKASGLGIANQLCRFTVETDLERPPRVLDFDGAPGRGWWLASVQPEPGYLGAVAVDGQVDGVEAFRLLPASDS